MTNTTINCKSLQRLSKPLKEEELEGNDFKIKHILDSALYSFKKLRFINHSLKNNSLS